MKIRITRPGRKHRIGAAHIAAAIENSGGPTLLGDAYWYWGNDDRGIELEIIAVPDDTGRADLSVIHAMPTAYRETS